MSGFMKDIPNALGDVSTSNFRKMQKHIVTAAIILGSAWYVSDDCNGLDDHPTYATMFASGQCFDNERELSECEELKLKINRAIDANINHNGFKGLKIGIQAKDKISIVAVIRGITVSSKPDNSSIWNIEGISDDFTLESAIEISSTIVKAESIRGGLTLNCNQDAYNIKDDHINICRNFFPDSSLQIPETIPNDTREDILRVLNSRI